MWNLLIRIAKEDDAEELLKIYSYYVKNSANFDEQKKESSKLCAEYLLYMDSKVHHLMKDDDIKLMFLN